LAIPAIRYASTVNFQMQDLAGSWWGIISIIVVSIAYAIIISEAFPHLRKSKAVMVAVGFIWSLVGITYAMQGNTHAVGTAR